MCNILYPTPNDEIWWGTKKRCGSPPTDLLADVWIAKLVTRHGGSTNDPLWPPVPRSPLITSMLSSFPLTQRLSAQKSSGITLLIESVNGIRIGSRKVSYTCLKVSSSGCPFTGSCTLSTWFYHSWHRCTLEDDPRKSLYCHFFRLARPDQVAMVSLQYLFTSRELISIWCV